MKSLALAAATLALAPVSLAQTPGAAGPLVQRETLPPRVFVQTDWSGGATTSSGAWGRGFESSTLSWRSVPGQLALPSTPKTTPVKQSVTDTFKVPTSVTTADIDGDGVADLLSSRAVSELFPTKLGALYWWKFTAPGTWTPITITGDLYGTHDLRAGDIDMDGDLDVVGCAFYDDADPRNGRYLWYENTTGDGSTWAPHAIGDKHWGPEDLELADMDADGDLDVIGQASLNYSSSTNPDVFWYENPGTAAAWSLRVVENAWPAALSVEVADLDGDGDPDIIANSYGVPDNVAYWPNLDGKGTMGARVAIEDQSVFSSKIHAVDLDEDGDVDVLGASLHLSPVIVWDNTNGDASAWGMLPIGAISAFGWQEILTHDLDGDGDLDVIAGADFGIGNHRLSWWENIGPVAALWPEHNLTPFDDGQHPALDVADLDGDGQVEIVGCAGAASAAHIFTWQVNDFLPAGDLISTPLDGGATGRWKALEWSADIPTGTSMTLRARTGDTPATLGLWVQVPASGAPLGSLLATSRRFLQYKVVFDSTSAAASPILREIRATRL
jgi:hypothetical protein